jgi:hypothetical protein
MWPRTVTRASTRCPRETVGAMCQYWNLRPVPEPTAIHSASILLTVPDSTGYTAVPSGAEMSMPL